MKPEEIEITVSDSTRKLTVPHTATHLIAGHGGTVIVESKTRFADDFSAAAPIVQAVQPATKAKSADFRALSDGQKKFADSIAPQIAKLKSRS